METGEFNDTLIIDERFIFRFPRSPEGIDQLRAEITVLNAIRDYISLPVPNPIFASQNMQTVGAVFMGYEMLPGVPLRNHLDALKANTTYSKVAIQLALFLRELHSFPAMVAGLELPAHDRGRLEALPRIYENVRESLYPHMHPDACDFVTDQFNTFLNSPASLSYRQVLRHGDLGPGNVLIDPQTQAISGVIDFGSTGLDDPAIDLGFVSFWGEALLGRAFVKQFYDGYAVTNTLLNRVRFFKVLIASMVAFEGLQQGDQEAFAFGLEGYGHARGAAQEHQGAV